MSRNKPSLTTGDILQRFKKAHGDRYDYSRVVYVKAKEKVIIGCREHGWFAQTPLLHKSGSGCRACSFVNGGNRRRNGHKEIISAFKKAHGNKYDYSRVNYIGIQKKVIIGCPIHGWFEQIPNSHKRGFGCVKCGLEATSKSNAITKKEFITRANKRHSNKFDYSLLDTVKFTNKGKVKIICPTHGIFLQRHDNHMAGVDCMQCKAEERGLKNRLTSQQFIDKATLVHGNKYDYSKMIYSTVTNSITIICPTHGEFSQKAKSHLEGKGCRKCRQSTGEKAIGHWLQSQSIVYESEKRFVDCISPSGYPLKFDFYLPTYNVIIEFDGKQHYSPIEFFGGKKRLMLNKEYDKIKDLYAKKKGIPLLRVPFFSFDEIPDLLTDFLADRNRS